MTATVRVVLGDISGCPDSPVVEAMTDTDILLSWKTPVSLNHAPVIAYKVQMGYIGECQDFFVLDPKTPYLGECLFISCDVH